MKAPYAWLKEYVPFGDMTAEELSSRLIATGTAVEDVYPAAGEISNVVVGKILEVVKHPDSDHLVVCTIDAGQETNLQIVTGAPNVKPGDVVPVALHNSMLPGGKKITKGKLRGVVSEGMLCSGPELDVPETLYPHCGNEGILQFREDITPGTDVRIPLGLSDTVLDCEILANRPDLLSMWGIAKETSAVLDIKAPVPYTCASSYENDKPITGASVRVEAPDLCPRYCSRIIHNVKIGPSPMWMRERLHAAGVRPISNIVDITNYVMLETGHPMHAFDLSKVRKQSIVVRRANEGESLTTLDGKQYTLNSSMLVISDDEHATGLAGIMGGEESEIVETTKDVLFECAAFNRASIRVTSRTLGIRTEASGRYERGVNPETVRIALDRACELVEMLGCGEVEEGLFDSRPELKPNAVIDISLKRVNTRNGVELTMDEAVSLLNRYDVTTECLDADTIRCTAPAWRQDLVMEADIAEELLRLYGYDKIPSTLMTGASTPGGIPENVKIEFIARNALVAKGFYESYTFSFISPSLIEAMPLDSEDPRRKPIVIRNPLGEDTSVMRTSLVPSMMGSTAWNISHGNAAFNLFEMSKVFGYLTPEEIAEKNVPYSEKSALCLCQYGDKVDFYTLRDNVISVLAIYGIKVSIEADGDAYYHPGRKAILRTADGTKVAQLGEIHPDYTAKFDISGRVYLAEVDMEVVEKLQQPIANIKPLPKFPAVTRDLALVMAESVQVGPVMDTIRKAAGRDLEQVSLFDIYRGIPVPPGFKSVAFSLSFRAADRTLTDEEISKAMAKVLENCEMQHNAQIR